MKFFFFKINSNYYTKMKKFNKIYFFEIKIYNLQITLNHNLKLKI